MPAAYSDPKFAAPVEKPLAEKDTRWYGHGLPPDPEPGGTIRVYDCGKWISWQQWQIQMGGGRKRDDYRNRVAPVENEKQRAPFTGGAQASLF